MNSLSCSWSSLPSMPTRPEWLLWRKVSTFMACPFSLLKRGIPGKRLAISVIFRCSPQPPQLQQHVSKSSWPSSNDSKPWWSSTSASRRRSIAWRSTRMWRCRWAISWRKGRGIEASTTKTCKRRLWHKDTAYNEWLWKTRKYRKSHLTWFLWVWGTDLHLLII